MVKGKVEKFAGGVAFTRASTKFQLLIRHLLAKVRDIVRNYYPRYQQVALGDYYLHPIFAAVVKSHPKHPKRAFNKVVKQWRGIIKNGAAPEFVRGLVSRALGFAKSYARGLFVWRRAKLPPHNNEHETSFHLKKGDYRRNSPNKRIGPTLVLTAPEEMFVPRNLAEWEIETILDWVDTPEYWQVWEELKSRSARRAYQKRCRADIGGVLDEIFAQMSND